MNQPIDICSDDSEGSDDEIEKSEEYCVSDKEDSISGDDDEGPEGGKNTLSEVHKDELIDLLDDGSDDELEDQIEDDDETALEVLFQTPPVVPTAASTAVLTAEDANLDPVAIALKYAFGHCSFRGEQQAIVYAALEQKDIMVLMPTGGGKSLCFQLPAVLSNGLTVVITPLISLMCDQIQALLCAPNGGIPVTYLSSQRSMKGRKEVFQELKKDHPTIKLLYTTPEQLQNSNGLVECLQDLCAREIVGDPVITVHEQHRLCSKAVPAVSLMEAFQLGVMTSGVLESQSLYTLCYIITCADQDYRKLGAFRKQFKTVPCTALTATATEDVRNDIIKSLQLGRTPAGLKNFKQSFFRNNLNLRVCAKPKGDDGFACLVAYLKDILKRHRTGAVIVYCVSRKQCAGVAALLSGNKVPALTYHAGMNSKKRSEAQEKWRKGTVRVVVATIAFGMGIDKPDVRAVVHWSLASSVQGYFQEIGRGGRDGAPSECTCFYDSKDVATLQFLIRKQRANRDRRMHQLEEMKGFCEMREGCRHESLLQCFGDSLPGNKCNNVCDLCVGVKPALLPPIPNATGGIDKEVLEKLKPKWPEINIPGGTKGAPKKRGRKRKGDGGKQSKKSAKKQKK